MWVEQIWQWMAEAVGEAIKYVSYFLFVFMGANVDTLTWFLIAVTLDMITGIYKVIVIPSLKFSGEKFRNGVLKKFILLVIPIAVGIGFKALGKDGAAILDYALRLFIVSEIISVLYNAASGWTGKETKSKDYVSVIIMGLAAYLGDIIISLFNKKDDKRK